MLKNTDKNGIQTVSLSAYQKLGLPTIDMVNAVDDSLGLVFQEDSAFLRGIMNTTSAETRAKTNGAVICAQSADDTPNNPHNPMYGIYKAGASGNLVSLIGTGTSNAGGYSVAPASMIDVSVKPTTIQSESDARGLVDTGKLATLLNGSSSSIVMDTIKRISMLKTKKITEAQATRDFIDCAYKQSAEQVAKFTDSASLDPKLDINIKAIENLSQTQADSSLSTFVLTNENFLKTSAVMKLVIEGYAGAGTIELEGFDYHVSDRKTGEKRDYAAGQAMGAVLEYAAKKNKPVMLYVFTDGSISSNGKVDPDPLGRGKCIWTSDKGETSSAFFLVYNPNGQPTLKNGTASQQIGYFRPNGSVETSATPASNNVTQLAQTIVLNYMALHNETGRFDKVIPDQGLGLPTDWDKLIAFEPIV